MPATDPTAEPDWPALLSAAAHDLRTPLSTIYGFARTIERMGEPLDEQRARFLEHILDSSRDLDALIGHLGLLARLGDGRFDPPREPISTADLATRTAEYLEREPGPPSLPAEVLTAPDAAAEAIGLLVRAATRLDPAASPLTVAGSGTAVAIGVLAPGVVALLELPPRDLAFGTALATIAGLDATLDVAADGSAAVRFPVA